MSEHYQLRCRHLDWLVPALATFPGDTEEAKVARRHLIQHFCMACSRAWSESVLYNPAVMMGRVLGFHPSGVRFVIPEPLRTPDFKLSHAWPAPAAI